SKYDIYVFYSCFFFQAEDGIRDRNVTGVQTCALPIYDYDILPCTYKSKYRRDYLAKKSKVVKAQKREQLVEQYEELRRELKAKGDYEALQKLPRDSSPTRVNNRCVVTGRPRGYMRKFDMSRIAFRELAHKGQIPGVRKASW